MMFKIGDTVQHIPTGQLGKVTGYGCQVTENTYFLTLKVKPQKSHFLPFLEDAMNQWRLVNFHQPYVVPTTSSNKKLVA